MSVPDYVKHIRHTHEEKKSMAWCGAVLTQFDFPFVDIDHAAYNNMHGGRLLLCDKCVVEIVKHLQHNAADDKKEDHA